MIWGLARCLFRVRKHRKGMSSILAHRHMYVSEKSTLIRYAGTRVGSASRTHPDVAWEGVTKAHCLFSR